MINGFDHIESNIINKCGQLLLNMSARTLNEHWVCFDSTAAATTIILFTISSEPYAQCMHSTLKPVSSFYRLHLCIHNNGAFFAVFLYLLLSSLHTIFCFVHNFNSLLSFDISFTFGSIAIDIAIIAADAITVVVVAAFAAAAATATAVVVGNGFIY